MNYYFHPGAEAEHFETIAFFESRQPGLGASYLSELEALMANVVHVPHRYRIERKPNIRCVSLKRFLYAGRGLQPVRQAKLVISCKVKVLAWNSKE